MSEKYPDNYWANFIEHVIDGDTYFRTGETVVSPMTPTSDAAKPRAAEKFIRLLKLIEPTDRLVRVKSWIPHFDPYGIAWPMLLVNRRGYYGERQTIQPIWNLGRLKYLFATPSNTEDSSK